MLNRASSIVSRLLARCWYVWGLSLCYTGGRYHDRSFFEAGVSAFGRATVCWPAYAQAYYQRGTVRGRELGEYEAAVSDLAQAIAFSPDWPEPYLQRGLLHRFNGNLTQARSDLTHYIAVADPGYWRDEAQRQLSGLADEI